MNDWELLQEYARNQADEAFTALVARYIGMVHSSALRQVDEPQLAEEITHGPSSHCLARNWKASLSGLAR